MLRASRSLRKGTDGGSMVQFKRRAPGVAGWAAKRGGRQSCALFLIEAVGFEVVIVLGSKS